MTATVQEIRAHLHRVIQAIEQAPKDRMDAEDHQVTAGLLALGNAHQTLLAPAALSPLTAAARAHLLEQAQTFCDEVEEVLATALAQQRA